ncbi:protein translocase subunit SecDF [Mycoplasmopsis cricetuli]|uniref:protein translocase subunit SecDF n=1 Tax=Mycoplasmopsis cricetuli TaxID=171283 RepID=UPI000470C36A|nr:protein translocase subunit SecDF [Mycoplasmopsis cricetuli]
MKRIKNFFKINNWKRILISVLTLGSATIAITFGSKYYISKNANKSVDYGGGVEAVIQVTKNGQIADNDLTEDVNKSIFDRLTGGTGLNGIKTSTESGGKIRIVKSGSLNDIERNLFFKEIIEKPILTITDFNLKPLFNDGIFKVDNELDLSSDSKKWIPPFKPNSAKHTTQNDRAVVEIELLNDDAVLQWTNATDYISKQKPNNTILMWLDILKLIDIAKNQYPNDWKESSENLWNFIHINNKAIENIDKSIPKLNPLKKNQIDIENRYLISIASVNNAINTKKVIISGNFQAESARNLANRINFGLSDYDLQVVSSHYLDSTLQSRAFYYAMIAGLLVFIAIAVFMIINYGLLGIISSFAIALYIFLTLLIFTALKVEYSPTTLAALIIGIGISVDANVITFERLKYEIYRGDLLSKSFKNSNRFSLASIIDANITTLIVGFILFYLGSKDVKGFSIALILSIFFTLIVMLVFTRFLSTMIVETGYFNNKLWALGIRKKRINNPAKIQLVINKIDYLNKSKWFALSSAIFILISFVVFGIIAGINSNFWSGINRSLEFSGGIDISILSRGESYGDLTLKQAQEMKQILIDNASKIEIQNIDNIIQIHKANVSSENYILKITSVQDISDLQIQQIKDLVSLVKEDIILNQFKVLSSEAVKLVINALIAIVIAFIGIVLYTLIRMNWTFAIAAILGLVHDFIMVVAFIILTRLKVSSIIIAAMLSIIGLSINDTIVTFNRIKEKIHSKYANTILTKDMIKNIVNTSIKDTLKRSLFTSFSTLIAIVILIAFKDATNFTFNIVMLFGISIGVYSSVFICSWIWSKLELFRQNKIQKRIDSNYWNIAKPDEQTFPGINDFNY